MLVASGGVNLRLNTREVRGLGRVHVDPGGLGTAAQTAPRGQDVHRVQQIALALRIAPMHDEGTGRQLEVKPGVVAKIEQVQGGDVHATRSGDLRQRETVARLSTLRANQIGEATPSMAAARRMARRVSASDAHALVPTRRSSKRRSSE